MTIRDIQKFRVGVNASSRMVSGIYRVLIRAIRLVISGFRDRHCERETKISLFRLLFSGPVALDEFLYNGLQCDSAQQYVWD